MASALATVLTRLTRRASNAIAAAALPLVGAGLDYLENTAAWATLAAFPDRPGTAETLLGVASAAKQTVSWIAGALLIAGTVAVVTQPWWRPRDPPITDSTVARRRRPARRAHDRSSTARPTTSPRPAEE